MNVYSDLLSLRLLPDDHQLLRLLRPFRFVFDLRSKRLIQVPTNRLVVHLPRTNDYSRTPKSVVHHREPLVLVPWIDLISLTEWTLIITQAPASFPIPYWTLLVPPTILTRIYSTLIGSVDYPPPTNLFLILNSPHHLILAPSPVWSSFITYSTGLQPPLVF